MKEYSAFGIIHKTSAWGSGAIRGSKIPKESIQHAQRALRAANIKQYRGLKEGKPMKRNPGRLGKVKNELGTTGEVKRAVEGMQ